MNPGVVKPVAVARAVTVVEKRASATIVPMTNLELLALVPRHGRSSRRRSPEVPGSLVRDVRREHEDDEGPAPDSLAATGRRHSWRVRESRARCDYRSDASRELHYLSVGPKRNEGAEPLDRARIPLPRRPSPEDGGYPVTPYPVRRSGERDIHEGGTPRGDGRVILRVPASESVVARKRRETQPTTPTGGWTRTPPGLPLSSARVSLRGRFASS